MVFISIVFNVCLSYTINRWHPCAPAINNQCGDISLWSLVHWAHDWQEYSKEASTNSFIKLASNPFPFEWSETDEDIQNWIIPLLSHWSCILLRIWTIKLSYMAAYWNYINLPSYYGLDYRQTLLSPEFYATSLWHYFASPTTSQHTQLTYDAIPRVVRIKVALDT